MKIENRESQTEEEKPQPRDISADVLRIMSQDKKDYQNAEELHNFIRSLRDEPEITVSLSFDELERVGMKPSWLKGFIEAVALQGKSQKRSASLRATANQIKEPGVPNVLASRVKFIEIDENGNEIEKEK